MKKLDTKEMMELLLRNDSFRQVLVQAEGSMQAPSLKSFLEEKRKERNMTIPQIMTAAGLSKSYIYQLFDGRRNAGRNAVLRIAFGMHLSVKETQQLLTISGNSILYPRRKRDAALIYALDKQSTLLETEIFLEELGEDTLQGGKTE